MHVLPKASESAPAPGSVVDTPAGPTDTGVDAIRSCKILVIDDEEPNVRLLERVLARAGFDNFVSTTDSREAAALFTDFEPDLVLTDWLMPDYDGCAVIGQLRALMATDDFLPIVVLTADITPHTRKRALNAGATDFLTKPFDQTEILLRIQNLLRARISHLVIQGQNATLEQSVRQRTLELERALTALQQSQQQVIQQERLAALGTMAGGIAHDFNNALSIIMGFGELLLSNTSGGLTPEEATTSVTSILTAADDAAKIVHRLREFYRPDESDQRLPIDLNLLIQQAVKLTQPRWKTKASAEGLTISVTTELREIPLVMGDASELREMITNLVFNAVDALPSGGAIALATRTEGQTILLRISDTGTGMTEEVRQRCLEPFFTTKGKRGTGLGLSMVFGIVQRHAGTVQIESELEKGTTFTISLPVADEVIAECISEVSPLVYGPLRVLVVDDQPILCQLVAAHLQEDLHTVETALNGREALEKFRAGEFDLVITDHVMAGMSGEQLAAEIKQLRPKVPVIMLTGYAGGSADEVPTSTTIDLVLGKPLSRADLRQALAKVMIHAPADSGR